MSLMNRTITPVLSVFLAFVLIAGGEPKLKKMSTENKLAGFKEEFTVLKDNPVVKQGHYVKMDMEKQVMVEGYYHNGRMDSIWTYYPAPGTPLRAVGEYEDDEKTGVWDYYNSEGVLEQKYDHANNLLLYFDTDATECEVAVGSESFKKMELDIPPLFIGGEAEMMSYMSDVFYPDKAKDAKVEGEVVVAMVINVDGTAARHEVRKGLGYGLDEEALRIAKKIPDNWLPGEFYEEKVPVRIELVIPFQLPS